MKGIVIDYEDILPRIVSLGMPDITRIVSDFSPQGQQIVYVGLGNQKSRREHCCLYHRKKVCIEDVCENFYQWFLQSQLLLSVWILSLTDCARS